MEGKILEFLLDNGKITIEDIREAKETIPTTYELDLLSEIHDCYCPLSHDQDLLECDFVLNKEGIAMKKYLTLIPLLRDHCARIAVETTNALCGDEESIPYPSDTSAHQQET